MVFVVCVIADVMDVYGDQFPLAGALKNAGFKVGEEYFGQKGEDLKLHN